MDDTASFILEIASQGSISKAADAIHISQSALSQRLKNVETTLGVELFNRRTIPIEPTEAGRAYLDWARGVVRSKQQLKLTLNSLRNQTQRCLRVGISAGRCPHLLADVTARFLTEVPDCRINYLDVGRRELIDAALVERSIDFSVMTPQMPEPSLFTSEVLSEERYVYLAPTSWDLDAVPGSDGLDIVAPESIVRHPFIMPVYGRRLIQIIDSIFEDLGEQPRTVCDCSSAPMMRELVRLGVGGTVVTTAGGGFGCPELACYEIRGIPGRSSLYYSHRRDHKPSADEAAFMRILREAIPRHQGPGGDLYPPIS